ncbi:MAG: S-layer homology domain-containing protein [Clostridia bacterium]|nr:S-layer homology domain-containing protein [Clostridia bacterium]
MMKKLVSMISAVAIAIGASTSAMAAFSDMPGGDMGAALERAVEVKLMNGVDETHIAPDDNITRAQMATILVRAFGAENIFEMFNETGEEYTFADVTSDKWYADMVSKAARMGAFKGDDENNFNPENNITFQETYIVLSRMFGFEPYEVKTRKTTVMLEEVDDSVLNGYGDAAEADDWAKDYVKYIVGNGGWTGINGQLKPKSYITRGEFAMIMDKLVTNYVDEPGTYKTLKDGLTLVRSGGVTIDGFTTDHNLIFTYGVDETGASAINTTVNGVTVVYGGIDKTPEPNTAGKLMPNESYISISGAFYDVRNLSPYALLNASSAKLQYYKGVDHSLVSMMLTQ